MHKDVKTVWEYEIGTEGSGVGVHQSSVRFSLSSY